MRVDNVKAWILLLTLLLARSTALFATAIPPPTDRSSLARNRPGPADSFLLSSQFPVLSRSLSSSIS